MHQKRQEGMVSILTIMFFMIFISIIVVSFIRIMYDEQRQSIDNDLSTSAYAAAMSGVEDAKRIILHCKDPDPAQNKSGCAQMLSSGAATGDCSALSNANGLRNGFLGIKNASMDGNQVIIGDPSYQQFYTCMTILEDTPEVKLPLREGTSSIRPLRGTAAFDSIRLTWSPEASSSGGGGGSAYVARLINGNFETFANWQQNVLVGGTLTAKRHPPVIRLQLIPYTAGAVNLDTVDRESRTLFVVPASNPALGADSIAVDNSRGSITSAGRLRSGAAPIVYATCSTSVGYSCSKVVTGLNSTLRSYYLRASVMYADSTSLNIELLSGATVVTFDGVQPQIDVTGRANDVYRRIRAYVSLGQNIVVPEYAVESGATICKELQVADAANSYYCP